MERTALIEYSHRTMAAIVGALVVWMAYRAWRQRQQNPALFRLSVAALVILSVQAWLGRVVVLGELDPAMVTVHLGTAMLLLAILIAIWLGWRPVHVDRGKGGSGRQWVAVAGIMAVILVGAWMRGLGAGLAIDDWPLMDGGLVPAGLDTASRVAAFAHRIVAGGVAVYLGYLAWRHRGREDRNLAGWVLGLYLLQVVAGGITVITDLAGPFRIVHVALAGLGWSVAFGWAHVTWRDARSSEQLAAP